MPCRSGYEGMESSSGPSKDEVERWFKEFNQEGEQREQYTLTLLEGVRNELSKVTELLCGVLSYQEALLSKAKFVNFISNVQKTISEDNYLAEWWKEHSEFDVERLKEELKENFTPAEIEKLKIILNDPENNDL